MDMTRIKIGKALGASKRFIDLLRSGPDQLLPTCAVAGYGYVESALHQRFVDDRIHGEWFVVSPSIIQVVLAIQQCGRSWSSREYPEHLRADGIAIVNGVERGLPGPRRYVAASTLYQTGFRARTRKPGVLVDAFAEETSDG